MIINYSARLELLEYCSWVVFRKVGGIVLFNVQLKGVFGVLRLIFQPLPQMLQQYFSMLDILLQTIEVFAYAQLSE